MHYYQFNIGDYISHTRHLSPIEDIAYRRLLDAYYLSESPLNTGVASVARQINMRDYENEVNTILNEFFTLTDDGWLNSRANKEIAKYREMVEAGKRGAAKRWLSPPDTPPIPLPNATLIANNKQETINKKHSMTPAPAGVSPETWDAFVQQRKAKKAQITQLVIDGITKQASLASWTLEDALKEIVVRNWTSFNAEWVKGKTTQTNYMRGVI
jgi:uncharacterized protein YdaU (DUF1376 family)